jgi:hypothetical protein
MVALFLLCPIILILFIVNYEKLFWYNYIAGYLIWMPVIGYLLCALFMHMSLNLRKNYQLLIFFLALPLGYGLNSNNSFFLTTSLSAFFSLLGLIVLLSGLSEPQRFAGRLIAMCAFCLTIVIGILVTSLGTPYRQPAILWTYNIKGAVRIGDKPLTLSPFTATYLLNLHTLAKHYNLPDNTPIIDLSGKTPGAVYAVGGYTPKVTSLNTGYLGIQKYAFFALNKLTCDEIADSWLILETKTLLETIDPFLLRAFGAKFPDDYAYSGMVIKHGDFKQFSSRSTELVFYRPMRPKEVAVSECVRSKTALKLME